VIITWKLKWKTHEGNTDVKKSESEDFTGGVPVVFMCRLEDVSY
jgi:hypothetical protein